MLVPTEAETHFPPTANVASVLSEAIEATIPVSKPCCTQPNGVLLHTHDTAGSPVPSTLQESYRMTTRNTTVRSLRSLVMTALPMSLALVACGDSKPGPANPCAEGGDGVNCPCDFSFDCPDLLSQQCVAGFCVPRDATEPPDADTGELTPDVPDSDVPLDVEDTDTDEDVDIEVGPDADTTPDIPDTDEDPEVGPDAEVSPDVETGPDTDVEDPPTDAQNPWIAFVERYIITVDGVPASRNRLGFVQADGTDRRSTDGDFLTVRTPRWSADGSKIAFIGRSPGVPRFNVHLQDVTTGDLDVIEVTAGSTAIVSLTGLDISRDATSFVVAGLAAGSPRDSLYRVTLDGTATVIPGTEDSGALSPHFNADDSLVYYARRGTGDVTDIYSIPVAGGTPTQVSFSSGMAGTFRMNRARTLALYQYDPSGSASSVLVTYNVATSTRGSTFGQNKDGDAVFLPDESTIITLRNFAAGDGTALDLAVLNASNGSLVRRVTFTAAGSDNPASPAASPLESDDQDLSALF